MESFHHFHCNAALISVRALEGIADKATNGLHLIDSQRPGAIVIK